MSGSDIDACPTSTCLFRRVCVIHKFWMLDAEIWKYYFSFVFNWLRINVTQGAVVAAALPGMQAQVLVLISKETL
jgi:hypothetical protein